MDKISYIIHFTNIDVKETITLTDSTMHNAISKLIDILFKECGMFDCIIHEAITENVFEENFNYIFKLISKSDNNKMKTAVADLSQTENPVKESLDSNVANPWFLFFTVLAATAILATIVLFIKLKFQKNVRT
jgi:hypothetical protein